MIGYVGASKLLLTRQDGTAMRVRPQKRKLQTCLHCNKDIAYTITREVSLAAVSFMRFVIRLRRKSGYLFTALYLKQCAVSLQRYYAGCYDPRASLSVPISLTRSGIPRIIPSVLRSHIRRRDAHGDMLVRLYRTWFGLSKLIAVARKSTFSSIVTPNPDIGSVKEVLGMIKESFKILQPLYLPDLPNIPLTKGMSWEPTWKSTPVLDSLLLNLGFSVDPVIDKARRRYLWFQKIFVNLKHEVNIKKITPAADF